MSHASAASKASATAFEMLMFWRVGLGPCSSRSDRTAVMTCCHRELIAEACMWGQTYRCPEPETSLDLAHRVLHARETLIHEEQSLLLGLLRGFRVHVLRCHLVIEVEQQSRNIGLEQNTETSVGVGLER